MKNQAQLKVFSPKETEKSKHYRIIAKSHVKGSVAYLLDWTYIFEKIDTYISKYNRNQCVILDVGCGNSMFHLFLEEYYGQGIIGIDREDSTLLKAELTEWGHTVTNATDLCFDFTEKGNNYFNNNVDIIFWNSSIEHNSIENMQQAMNASMKALKHNGIFIATWAFGGKTHWNESAEATVLSEKDAPNVFNGEWETQPDFAEIIKEWKSNVLGLDDWHNKRFGHDDYEYVHAGCSIEKQ
tara:strand:+ start:602 stop:1321 length:720 start_codon:yes stop_codon:yes gene_type:complete